MLYLTGKDYSVSLLPLPKERQKQSTGLGCPPDPEVSKWQESDLSFKSVLLFEGYRIAAYKARY